MTRAQETVVLTWLSERPHRSSSSWSCVLSAVITAAPWTPFSDSSSGVSSAEVSGPLVLEGALLGAGEATAAAAAMPVTAAPA